jgi:hypothetical protein
VTIGHRYLSVDFKACALLPSITDKDVDCRVDCNRLFPSRERLIFHRKRDHDSEEDRDIITWNE